MKMMELILLALLLVSDNSEKLPFKDVHCKFNERQVAAGVLTEFKFIHHQNIQEICDKHLENCLLPRFKFIVVKATTGNHKTTQDNKRRMVTHKTVLFFICIKSFAKKQGILSFFSISHVLDIFSIQISNLKQLKFSKLFA